MQEEVEIVPLDTSEEHPDSIEQQPKSHKSIYFLIQAFLSFAENLGYQYLPIYNRKLGASETQMGLLTSVQNVGRTIMQPFWGRLSDERGRKVFMLLGGFIAFAAMTAMIFVRGPIELIIALGINSIGVSILFPAWQGSIADYTEGQKRGGFMGRLLGVSYAYVTVAFVAYIFLSPLLPLSELGQYRLVIGVSAANFFIVVLLSWIIIDLKNPEKTIKRESLFTPLKDKTYRIFLMTILYWWFFMSLAWSYFPLVIADIILATPLEVAYIAISATITQGLASYKLADYIDKIGEKKAINIGFLAFSIVPLTFAFATEWWHLIPAQLIAGIGIGFGFTAMRSYIIEIGGSDRAGNYQGIYQLLWGITTFSGSFLGGIVLDWYVDVVGSLSFALTSILLIIAGLRFSSNIVIWKYMPDPISNLPEEFM